MAPDPPAREPFSAQEGAPAAGDVSPRLTSDGGACTDVESLQITMMERARRLMAAELELVETRCRLLESNLQITEAQLALAEREVVELAAENERLRRALETLTAGQGDV